MIEKDPFAVLGLQYGADNETVGKRFKELAKQYHPDLAPGNEVKMQEINEAYDAIKRGDYHAEVYYYPPQGSREAQKAAGEAQREQEMRYAAAPPQENTQEQPQNQEPYWYYRGIPLTRKKYLFFIALTRFVLPLLAIALGIAIIAGVWHVVIGTNLFKEVVEAFRVTHDTFSPLIK